MKHRTCAHCMTLLVFMCGLMAILSLSGGNVSAQGSSPEQVNDLSISINMTGISITESDHFTFSTMLTNNGTGATTPLVAHLNVASLQEGLYVDPEDWSEQRTIFVDPVAGGASVNLTWTIHGLFAGDFAIYVVVLAQDTSSFPIVSDEILVHIEKWEVLQIADVTPVVTAVPILMGVLFVGQRSWIALHLRRGKDLKSRKGKAE